MMRFLEHEKRFEARIEADTEKATWKIAIYSVSVRYEREGTVLSKGELVAAPARALPYSLAVQLQSSIMWAFEVGVKQGMSFKPPDVSFKVIGFDEDDPSNKYYYHEGK